MIEKWLISLVRSLKSILGVKTYVVETAFVFLVLAATALTFGKEWQEWIAVFAVLFTFKHASVSNRMEEQEALRKEKGEEVRVDCYRRSTQYFYTKEILWFAYFLLAGSYSALSGVIVFLLYGWWRKTWRQYNPIK